MLALLSMKGVQVFERETEVMKSDEVPAVALVVVEGEADILKHNEEFLQISPGYVLGLDQLHKNSPSNLNLRAKPNLRAILLSKFDMYQDSIVYPLLQQLMGTP